MIKVLKYRIKDRHARKALSQYAYACNQVWNWMVAQHRDGDSRYRLGAPSRRWPSHFDLGKQCNGLGAMLGILQSSVQFVCDQFVRNRNQHKCCPAFRSSFGSRRSLGWVPFKGRDRKVSGNTITYLGKTFRFFGSKRRPLPAIVKGGYFTEDAMGRWFVCFYVDVEKAVTATQGEVGIDLGLKDFATLSEGRKIEAPRIFDVYAERLAIAQRAGNKRRAAAINAKIANARRDFHHKLSTDLARTYAFIAVGNVSAKALAKTRMAKSVNDAGWSAFRTMLKYKASTFIEADEKFTTQTCSSCGGLPPERPQGIAGLGMRQWDCSYCGARHDRDVNAARNILAVGRSTAPLVEGSRRVAS